MAPAKVVSPRKGPVKTLTSTSLKANMPNRRIEARKFKNIPTTVDLPPPEHLQESDNASKELLKSRAEFHALSAGYKKRIRALVVFIYGIALFLKADEAAWIKFTQHKEWMHAKRRPQFDDQNDALRYALRFAVGLTGSAASKRASKYYLALVSWFEKDTPAQEVLVKIKKAGGFDVLASRRAEEKAKTKKPPRPSRPVAAKDGKPGASKGTQSAAIWNAELRRELDQESDEGSAISIAVVANKNTELLLKSKSSERLKMTFSVDSVRGRRVNISDARVKLTPKKRKKAAP